MNYNYKYSENNSSKEPSNSANKVAKKIVRTITTVVLCVFMLVCIFTSMYKLNENQDAIVTTFGKPSLVTESGMHFKIPFVQHVKKINVSINSMPIGYDPETKQFLENESLMITKDFNFIKVDFNVNWQIVDAVKYMYAAEDPEMVLKTLAMSYFRDTIGSYTVDEVLTTGKVQIQNEVMNKLTARLEHEDIGIAVKNLSIQDAAPPTDEVSAAFKAVEDAKQKASENVNNAKAYQNQQIPAAEAKADKIMNTAEAEKQGRINEANGQIARFNAMYEEYIKYPNVTKQRMYFETMENLLPGIRVIIKDSDGTMVNVLGGNK